MNLRQFHNSLLGRIILAIIAGIICSFFFPEALGRVFITFNSFFGNFLGFFVPVLIFALITPAIAGLGHGAGKWLLLTIFIAYFSTIFSGLLAFLIAQGSYDWLLEGHSTQTVANIEEGALDPFFSIEFEPPFGVLTALILAFTLGLAMTAVPSQTLFKASKELEAVIMKVIESFIVPLLPVYIFGIFLSLGMNGNLQDTLRAFGKILILAIIMTAVLLLLQFFIAGIIAGANPLRLLKNMLPAYATALGTSSSAATIPVSLECTKKNGVSDSVAGFVVPLCATIHLAGSMMKISLFAYAIAYMAGIEISWSQALGFMFFLGVSMVAAPGVPGGAIMAAVGVLQSMLGFDQDQIALMIAAYIAIDSFGTACNVTGDGAISVIVNKYAKGSIPRTPEDQPLTPSLENESLP